MTNWASLMVYIVWMSMPKRIRITTRQKIKQSFTLRNYWLFRSTWRSELTNVQFSMFQRRISMWKLYKCSSKDNVCNDKGLIGEINCRFRKCSDSTDFKCKPPSGFCKLWRQMSNYNIDDRGDNSDEYAYYEGMNLIKSTTHCKYIDEYIDVFIQPNAFQNPIFIHGRRLRWSNRWLLYFMIDSHWIYAVDDLEKLWISEGSA